MNIKMNMKVIEENPGRIDLEEYKKIIEMLDLFLKNKYVLAGGAPRNWDQGKKVKNLDFYVDARYEPLFNYFYNSRKPHHPYTDIKEIFGSLCMTQMAYGSCDYLKDGVKFKERSSISTIYRIDSFAKDGSLERLNLCDIIFVKSKARSLEDFGLEVVNRFDSGICAIFKIGAMVYKTDKYLEDVKNRKVTIFLPNITTKGHVNRLKEYYEDFKFVEVDEKMNAKIAKREVGKCVF